MRLEEEKLDQLRKEEARRRRLNLPSRFPSLTSMLYTHRLCNRKLTMRHGAIYVAPNPHDPDEADRDEVPGELVNLDGATITKAVDPLDGKSAIQNASGSYSIP